MTYHSLPRTQLLCGARGRCGSMTNKFMWNNMIINDHVSRLPQSPSVIQLHVDTEIDLKDTILF